MAVFATNVFKDPRATALTNFSTTGAALTALSLITDFPGAIATAVRATRIGSGAARLVDFKIGTEYVLNTQYRLLLQVRASEDMAVNILARPNVTSTTNSVTFSSPTIPTGVSIIDVTGTTSALGTPGASSGFVISRTAGSIGSTLDVTAILIQRLPDSDIGYFDGSVPSNPSVVYRWLGPVNDSLSTAETGTGILDSRKKMWFGSENHMQAVPLPATGMQVSRSGYSEEISPNSGRKNLYRSHQTSKTYNMDFPVQEAHMLEGLDVFAKFASGFYGDCNRYPLFFADPMNYTANLMPEAWATPGLYTSGWNSIVADQPVTYTNYALNPSGEVSSLYWRIPVGVTGTITTPAVTSTPYGSKVIRGTKTSGTGMSVEYGRDQSNALASPASAGITYTASVAFRTSMSTTVRVSLQFYSGAGSLLGSASSSIVSTTLNVWNSASVALQAPASTVWMTVLIEGTTTAHWVAASTLDVDGLLIQNQTFARPQGFFDGDTPGATWSQARGLSISQMYVSTSPGVPSASPATGAAGLPALAVTWPITTAPNAFPTPDNTYGNIPYAIIPIPTGYALWVSATGSATGSAALRVDQCETAMSGGTVVGTQYATLSSTFWASPSVINSYSGAPTYAKIFVTKTTAVASTITLSSIIAQLWPLGVTPPTPTQFSAGQGHRGLNFTDSAVSENYVMIDTNRNVPIHYKGLSTVLEESDVNN